jgi:5-dehydro-2-deoxygluconokinase
MGFIQFDKSRELDIIPLGRVTIDFNPIDMFKTLAESTTFKKYLGGSPANIAVGLSRLGKKVGFIGMVSKDRFGEFVINYFKNEGIDTSHIAEARNNESLGLTFTEIKSEKESSILMYRNGIADLSLDTSDIDEKYISSAKVLLVSGTALSQSPSREAAFKAVELAKKTNTPIIFDIDYREYNWRGKDEIAVYYNLLGRNSDIIFGSREEFDLMQGLFDLDTDDCQTAKRWFSRGAKILVIKHGKEGSNVFTNDGTCYSVKPLPIKKLKGFGGGDAYASAFIYGLLESWSVEKALEFGSASASLLVASHSCSDAMPSVDKIDEYIRMCKEEYDESVTKVSKSKFEL